MPSLKKAYCFTLNNYTPEEYTKICKHGQDDANYCIIGKEVGESGTPHLQGYIIFTRPYRFSTIKDRYLSRCHIEVAAGNADSNRAYCSKSGDFVEFGTKPKSLNTRAELAVSFAAAAEQGRDGLVSWASEQPGTWYFSGHNLLRNYHALQPAVRRDDISVLWIWGKPGTGKSRRAHEAMPEAFVKEPRTKWWSGYQLEKEVIIDDFGPQGIDINHLLRWFDRYKCYVESKGGMLPLLADKFIITSNFHPAEVFSFGDLVNPQLPALLRRIVIEEM
jgi:hypothetical protein